MNTAARRRAAFSVSSWFCIPEQNMRDMEILNRASAFLVPSKNPKFDRKFHVVTCSHTVAPWKWPKYYPEEWLQFVNEKHTFYTLELRNENGSFMTQNFLMHRVFHHPRKDLAVIHLSGEDFVMGMLSKLLPVVGESLYPAGLKDISVDDVLEVHGHQLVVPDGQPSDTSDEDLRLPVPVVIRGNLSSFKNADQNFAKTETVLTQGMCGGPVMVNPAGEDSWHTYGMIDGIVPTDHPRADIQGLASFITHDEIKSFLSDVEDGLIQPVLGGDVVQTINADQDPTKTLEAVLKKHL